MTASDYPWGDAADLRIEAVDWSYQAAYIRTRHLRKPGETSIEPEWATEAVFDFNRIIAAPDPASKNGKTIRVIGLSQHAREVLAVILMPDSEPSEFKGVWIGVNAWIANSTMTKRYYKEGGS